MKIKLVIVSLSCFFFAFLSSCNKEKYNYEPNYEGDELVANGFFGRKRGIYHPN